MKVLVVGSGGREHSIVWKLAQSKRVSKIYCAPGNIGIKNIANCIDIKTYDIDGLCDFAKEHQVNLTVVNSESSIKKGIANKFKENNLLIFAPSKEAAQIETSKSFSKKLMGKYRIPTPHFSIFTVEVQAIDYLKRAQYPLVIKYDSNAASRGVFACESFEQAKKAVNLCFESLYPAVIIEQYISGIEASLHVVTDGYTAIPFPSCHEYKKLHDGNIGPITSGMGCYAPAHIIDDKLEQKIAQQIIFPLLDGLSSEGTPFSGTLNAKIMFDNHNNMYALGFNARFGNPETQTILPLLEDDLFEIMYSTAIGSLSDDYEYFNINNSSSVTVVLASQGYPAAYKKGHIITGMENFDNDDDIFIAYSGTILNKYGELITDGGRVLSATSTSSTLHRAYTKAYEAVNLIKFKNMKFRKDIARSQVKEKIYFL